MGKLCIFTGHRALPGDLLPLRQALRRKILQLAADGFTRFASGGAAGFDLLAAELILELRRQVPELELHMILPCKGQDRTYSVGDRVRYRRVLESAGYTVGIISQPNWRDPKSIDVFGRPRLGFLVSGGNMDSMVNHYSVTKHRRKTDALGKGQP